MLLVLGEGCGGERRYGRRHLAQLARSRRGESGVVGEDREVLQAGGHSGDRKVTRQPTRWKGVSALVATRRRAEARRGAGEYGIGADGEQRCAPGEDPAHADEKVPSTRRLGHGLALEVLNDVGDARPHGRHTDVVVQIVELLGHGEELTLGPLEFVLWFVHHFTAPCVAGAALLVL